MRFSELDGASVGVWGAGREIASFADQLARRLPSARIVAAAFDAPPVHYVRETLCSPDLRILCSGDAYAGLCECDVIVRSPGVSIYRPELRALREAGVPVTTATALWLAEHGSEGVLAVTGTKGKSTTAALACHLARVAGVDARLAGNIGVPALDLLDGERAELVVLELSSYQLADLAVGPQVALVTNLFREHTDWHGSEEAYRADKLRVLSLPGVRTVVLNARDGQLMDVDTDTEAVGYGTSDGWHVADGTVAFREETVAAIAELPLPGEHNALNLCGALTGLEAVGVAPPQSLSSALAGFRPLAHRLETVAESDGVLWVNDSISTTPESTLAALASFPGRAVVLIAGGQDRGQDYAALASALVLQAGAVLIGVGSTGGRLVAAAREAGVPDARAATAADLAAAVACARGLAQPGGVVLLSPAAPSYDEYGNFEERGERFRALAQQAL